MTQPYSSRLFSVKYHTISRNINKPQIMSASIQNNQLVLINNPEYISSTQFYTVNKSLLITKLDINNITYSSIFEFDFTNKNNNKTEVNILQNNLLIVKTTDIEEINFLRNIILAESCLGFSEDTKIKNKSKYGLFFNEKGKFFITLSEELCHTNLLVVNVL
tara:strand:- start:94 stop:579 length:486 start_codon:yes stop_codon:yes gene_type:complete